MSNLSRLSITFHLTHDCNLACDYCYTGEKLSIPMSQEMADSSIQFVVQEVQAKQVEQLEITFFGGEPLLEKEHIFYIQDQLNALITNCKIFYRMSTNGILVTEELMKVLFERRIYVSLSLDGDMEVYDRHRLTKKKRSIFDKVVGAAKILLRYNPATNVTAVMTPQTCARLTESVDFLFNLGFRYMTVTLDYSSNWTTADFKALKKSYQQLAKWYEAKMIAQERFYLSLFDERIRTHTQKPLEKEERCNIGQGQLSIAPNGEIYPCIQFVKTEGNPEYLIGHVQEGVDSACNNHIHACSEQPKPECDGCPLINRCSNWCACINYMDTGTVTQVSPVVCYNEKILIEIVDKTADRLWKQHNNMFVHKHYNPDYAIISHYEICL